MNIKSIGIVIALLLIMFMSAIETSIVSLALPTIKDDLNVTSSISLIFAVYFIAIVIANPIVGELLERTRMIYITMFGLLCFTIGSLFSGLSETFTILIISRFIQGLGAGIMMALCQIVPKLAFEIPLRYKIMGIVGSVWGISSIIGPVLGGGILEFASWHWLFFVNIPIAILAMVLALMTFHFDNETSSTENGRKSKLDIRGLTLFYIFIFFLLFAVMNTSHIYLNVIAFVVACIVAMILYKNEKSISMPFVPVKEFNKMIVLVFTTDFLYAIMLMGYNLYMPVYLQEELKLLPLQSGFVIFPISFAWLMLNFSLAKIEMRLSRKMLYLAAFTSLLLCSILVFVGTEHPLFIAFSLLFAGVSFGTVYTKDSVITQEETSPEHMKRMMSLYTLTKSLGNSIGSTIMGYVYAMSILFIGLQIHNVLLLVCIILFILIILWSFMYKPHIDNNGS
ncbi:MFS transporter [Staphylococcus gallinarum]|uniref:multidrug efflux MFS transporter SdrM n=1 Tax=Staphylococcus gallinarum TaxID=1293 RepID=UPI001E5C78E4|nr:multidrug efflux MFS transporter SdrM [Staphylococcus gallinarum]MCD8900275.1 MFS transporter [Staphylococcus gallinarum]MCD8903152.1 MFS transporter [Staphylococcus gallinarum]MEB6238016.1 MFS transporter [Staphylococcus gallinarum]